MLGDFHCLWNKILRLVFKILCNPPSAYNSPWMFHDLKHGQVLLPEQACVRGPFQLGSSSDCLQTSLLDLGMCSSLFPLSPALPPTLRSDPSAPWWLAWELSHQSTAPLPVGLSIWHLPSIDGAFCDSALKNVIITPSQLELETFPLTPTPRIVLCT